MPKGFLVKRSKRTGPASYRVRDEEEPPCRTLPADPGRPAHRTPARCCYGGLPVLAPSLSPTRPDGERYSNQRPELFPEPLPGAFALSGAPVSPSLPETSRDPQAKRAPKKRRAPRDDVTISPVLGLRIKEPEEEPQRASGAASPLGEFVCQLCKERYADPLGLAHHRCSRIVRVEYRCDECDKVFSCPANLASHRRWHKPKGPGDTESPRPPSSSSSSSSPAASSEDDDATFGCPICSKRFRRQAYLRKHLALHGRKEPRPPAAESRPFVAEPRPLLAEVSPEVPLSEASAAAMFQCRFCGESFFSSPGLTRHINQHHPTESRRIILIS